MTAARARPPRAPKAPRREEQLFDALARLKDDRARRTFLAGKPALAKAEVVARLAEEVPRRVRVDPQQAMALAEAAELIARRLKSREALAQGLRAKGNALYGLNHHKAAVEHHERAIAIFEELGLDTEMGRTLSTSLQPLILQGEYDRALAAAARARAIFTRQGDDLRLARLELNVGNIYHRQDRFTEALRSYEQAYEGLLPHRNVEGIAVALSNMAMCLITLNDFPRALETYQRARQYSMEQGLPALVSLADYNIAYLWYFRGQYSRAIEALRATRQACRGEGDAYIGALCNLDLAEIHLELNLGEDAAEMAEQALNAFRKLGNGYEAAKALSFLAIAHGQQGKVFLALEMFGEARELFVREQNLVWPALLDLYRALILFEAGRLPEARRSCLAALEGFRPSALASKTILCRLLLSRLALRTGDLDAARHEVDEATTILSSLDLPAVAFQLHFVRGQIETAAGQPAQAYASYRRAQEALETLRSSLRGEELKIAFMKNKLEVYESLVDLALGSGPGGAEEAFGYVEQAKSRSLLDLIVRGAPSPPATAAGKSELVRRVGELREELNWYYHRIEAEQLTPEARTGERLERLHTQVQAHEAELLRVLRELPATESEQMALHMPVTLDLKAIQAALPEDAMLVEYFRVGQRLVAFLVTRDSLEAVPVALVSRVRHILRLLKFQLSWAGPNPAQQVRGFQESHRLASQAHLEELYQELIAPLRRRLRGEHLIFVPHDVLHYVPFHALFDGERHLIDSFTVSYAPSATVYALCQGRPTVPAGSALILGIPDQRTPHILEEVQSVAARLPRPELFLGAHADEGVLRDKGPQSRFVHIATHGFFRGDNPMFSGIRLGGSHLTLYDFYSLKLPAELVALSACVSGLNVIAVGDEVLGLARGVFAAGASSLLAALWEVPDQSTADFMRSFYGRFLTTPNKAAALRDAIQEVRTHYPHPVHWAPFLLIGKVFP
jgi:CHAT domain-containing protein